MAVIRQNSVWMVGSGYAKRIPDFPISHHNHVFKDDILTLQPHRVVGLNDRGDLQLLLPHGKTIPLTQGGGFMDTVPLWLDDHRLIAGRSALHADLDGGVWLVDISKHTEEQILPAEDADFGLANTFRLSPDGKWIAIGEFAAPGMVIEIVRRDNWQQARHWHAPSELVHGHGKFRKPGQFQYFEGGSGFAWQDSHHLLVACDSDSSSASSISRVDVDTGQRHPLLHPTHGEVSDVRYDPHRKEMIVAADIAGPQVELISDVTQQKRSVTISGNFDLGDLSPNGQYLSVLVKQRERNLSTLYWLDLDTLQLTRICPDVQAASWVSKGE